MSLLVEYSIVDGKSSEQVEALQSFVGALKILDDSGFDYTAYETDDPTKFIAVLDFDDADAKERFLACQAFAEYRDGTKGRFSSPPATTNIRLVASSRA